MRHRLEAQYVLAFGITLERQEPEVDLEQRHSIISRPPQQDELDRVRIDRSLTC